MWPDEDGGWSTVPVDSESTGQVTATPGGLLDVGGEVFDFAKASLGKLLDVYTYREVAEINSMYSPPPGYQRVPGTTQVVKAGAVGGGVSAAGMSATTVILLLAVVYLFAKKA